MIGKTNAIIYNKGIELKARYLHNIKIECVDPGYSSENDRDHPKTYPFIEIEVIDNQAEPYTSPRHLRTGVYAKYPYSTYSSFSSEDLIGIIFMDWRASQDLFGLNADYAPPSDNDDYTEGLNSNAGIIIPIREKNLILDTNGWIESLTDLSFYNWGYFTNANLKSDGYDFSYLPSNMYFRIASDTVTKL